MTINKNKDFEYCLQKGNEKGGVYTNFYTEDKGSASIRIRLSSNEYFLDLTKIDLKPVLFLFHEDGSIFEIKDFINVMPDKGLIQYNLSDNVIAHAGKVKAKLFLKNTKQSVHVANFTFDIKDSGIEGAVAKEVSVDIVDDAVRRIVKENAIEILGDGFKDDVSVELKNYVNDNVETFKGPKGDEGKQGQRGPQGDKGDKGDQGLQGIQGVKGDRGYQGIQGPKGEKGDTGPKGEDGKDADMEVINSLKEDDYYNISYEKYFDELSSTEYHVTVIPHKDKNDNVIKLKRGFANDNFSDAVLETPRNFSNRKNLSFAANASIFNTTTNISQGIQINENEIIQNTPHNQNYTLGIKNDNSLVCYSSEVTAQEIIDDGCHIGLTGFYPIINNGVKPIYSDYTNTSIVEGKYARQIIGNNSNNDIIFITVQGNGINGIGMTFEDMYRISSLHGLVNSYCLDGGGSAQTIVRGSLINTPMDSNGYEERKVSDFLYVEKAVDNNRGVNYNYDFGKISKNVSDLSVDIESLNNIPENVEKTTDLNNISTNGFYWAQSSTLNSPGLISYAVLHFQYDANNAAQIAYPYHTTDSQILMRRTINGMSNWSAWRSNNLSSDWTPLTLQNNWVNYGGSEPIAEFKLQNGVVYTRGLISGGTTTLSTVLFTLPQGMRPSKKEYVTTISKSSTGTVLTRLIIETNGEVKIMEGANSWLILNNSFVL